MSQGRNPLGLFKFYWTDATNSLKTSVSNGKSAVASAITDKGISTSATATFDTMASNIRSLNIALNLWDGNIRPVFNARGEVIVFHTLPAPSMIKAKMINIGYLTNINSLEYVDLTLQVGKTYLASEYSYTKMKTFYNRSTGSVSYNEDTETAYQQFKVLNTAYSQYSVLTVKASSSNGSLFLNANSSYLANYVCGSVEFIY